MLDKLKLYCTKVLPSVYEESLSYYEVLTKLEAKMNELVDTFNSIITDKIKILLNEYFVESTYDAETETLTIKSAERS